MVPGKKVAGTGEVNGGIEKIYAGEWAEGE